MDLVCVIPLSTASHEYHSSRKVTSALTDALLAGFSHCSEANRSATTAKATLKAARVQADKQLLAEIQQSKSEPVFDRRVAPLQEKGTSSWLNAVPLAEHDLFFHKTGFRDCLALRYGWQVSNLPERCVCGDAFSPDHAMACKVGGFPIFRHNLIRDFTADCLREVCVDVETEPALQPLSGERFRYSTACTNDGDRLDVRARGLWENRWQDC